MIIFIHLPFMKSSICISLHPVSLNRMEDGEWRPMADDHMLKIGKWKLMNKEWTDYRRMTALKFDIKMIDCVF